MSITEYKNHIKRIIDATDNEALLKHWQKLIEWDVTHENEVELTKTEWQQVQEGVAEYYRGEVISLDEYIGKRNDRL